MPRAIRARKKKGLLRGPFLFVALLGGLEEYRADFEVENLTPSLPASDGTSRGAQT